MSAKERRTEAGPGDAKTTSSVRRAEPSPRRHRRRLKWPPIGTSCFRLPTRSHRQRWSVTERQSTLSTLFRPFAGPALARESTATLRGQARKRAPSGNTMTGTQPISQSSQVNRTICGPVWSSAKCPGSCCPPQCALGGFHGTRSWREVANNRGSEQEPSVQLNRHQKQGAAQHGTVRHFSPAATDSPSWPCCCAT